MKKNLEIGQLKKIKKILDGDLGFFVDSIYKMNLAYQVQFLQFLRQLEDNYNLYGGLKNIFYRYALICISNIYEYLLRVALLQKGLVTNRKRVNFGSLISTAKNKNLISKLLAKELSAVYNERNKIHPEKQKNLDVITFDKKLFMRAFVGLEEILRSLRCSLRENEITLRSQKESCDYCIIFSGDVCIACGNLAI